MLILAGVSLNAIIGDNGVVTNAQRANILQRCAVLEEYFNELYVSVIADGVSEDVERGDGKLDVLLLNGYEDYIFHTSEGACYKKIFPITLEDGTSTTQTYVFYLIQADKLPDDIKSSLNVSKPKDSRDYRKFEDVYGITSDLKVYYCSSGLDSIVGLTLADINADSPDIIAYESDSLVAQLVNGGSEAVSNRDLKSVKTITIDETSKVALLKEFRNFKSLTTVYFTNVSVDTLDGINGAALTLNYLKFTNTEVKDYSALNVCTNLEYLYFINPKGKNAEITTLCSEDKGIAKGEFGKLKYFGIVGLERWIQSTSRETTDIHFGVTDISGLANLTKTTKEAVKYLYLHNLNISSISSLADFKNVLILRLDRNPLNSLDGLQNMSELQMVFGARFGSSLGSSESESAANSSTDALAALQGNKSISMLDLIYNISLKRVSYLSECTNLTSLYLEGCSSIIDVSSISNVIGNCGTSYTLDGKYGTDIISSSTTVLKLSGEVSKTNFEKLSSCSSMTHLSLANIKIMDGTNELTGAALNTEINNVLKNITTLNFLSLYGVSSVTSLDFCNNLSELLELDLRGTSVTDLSILKTTVPNLRCLAINNSGITITSIQDVINRLSGSGYWSGFRGIALQNAELVKQLSNTTQLTQLTFWMQDTIAHQTGYWVDLSKNPNLTTISGNCDIKMILPQSLESFKWCFPISLQIPEVNHIKSFHISNAYRSRSGYDSEWKTAFSNLGKSDKLQSINLEMGPSSHASSESIFGGFSSSTLTSFTCSYSSVGWLDDFTFLSRCPNLTNITISSYGATDVSPLQNLTKLTTLTLINGSITSISSLDKLTELTTLNLSSNQIRNIDVVSNFTKLTSLNVANNKIDDIYSISNLKNLITLNLRNNSLSDSALHGSVAYEPIDIFYDLNYQKKGSLKNLYIDNNNFDDVEILLDLNWESKSGFNEEL